MISWTLGSTMVGNVVILNPSHSLISKMESLCNASNKTVYRFGLLAKRQQMPMLRFR